MAILQQILWLPVRFQAESIELSTFQTGWSGDGYLKGLLFPCGGSWLFILQTFTQALHQLRQTRLQQRMASLLPIGSLSSAGIPSLGQFIGHLSSPLAEKWAMHFYLGGGGRQERSQSVCTAVSCCFIARCSVVMLRFRSTSQNGYEEAKMVGGKMPFVPR